MNVSLCSLPSQSSLFSTSSLPSFDKINTMWKTQSEKNSTNSDSTPLAFPKSTSKENSPVTFTMSKSKKEKAPLPPSFKPGPYSVICGRTQKCYNSTGNRRFRLTVKMFLKDYMEAEGKPEKSEVVSRVLDIFQEASPIGSFVTYENGRWHEVSERIKREKIGGLFRDLLHTQYKSSAKAKQARKAARFKLLEERKQLQQQNQLQPQQQPQLFEPTTTNQTQMEQQCTKNTGTQYNDNAASNCGALGYVSCFHNLDMLEDLDSHALGYNNNNLFTPSSWENVFMV